MTTIKLTIIRGAEKFVGEGAGEVWQARHRGTIAHARLLLLLLCGASSSRGHLVPTAMVAELGHSFDRSETINPANDGLMVRPEPTYCSHCVRGTIVASDVLV